ncbi:site-specific integrase [Amycolatopsis thermoflava]|uniref:site-specific integrase n=1 Tax=Amycolatopsis thermoflava TaxID=84480 RepID=UPI003EBEF532
MADGSSKQVRRRGATATKAEDNLKEAMRDLTAEARAREISKYTRFEKICWAWFEDFELDYASAGKDNQTPQLYKSYLRNWIVPNLGQLQAHEVLPSRCDKLVRKGQAQSYSTAASIRTVLSAVCAYGVRHGAFDFNPVKSIGRLTRPSQKTVKAMTLEQRQEMFAALREYGEKKSRDKNGRRLGPRSQFWRDLPDIMEAFLATGGRLGEILALDGDEVEPTAPTVYLGHHLVRVTGKGLLRVANRKGDEDALLLRVPQWSVPMWRRRKLASGGGALFPSWAGGYLDPSNATKNIRAALDECGYEWVTSHVWRKTVATVLDDAGLTTTQIADQLGNTPRVVEKHYRAKRVSNEHAVAALELMFGTDDEEK